MSRFPRGMRGLQAKKRGSGLSRQRHEYRDGDNRQMMSRLHFNILEFWPWPDRENGNTHDP